MTPAIPTNPRKKMPKIAFAGFIGTLIEGYDFTIYGFAAALVFPQVFFPTLGGAAGIVVSLATFGVAFLARPLGSIIFGHFGDRLGRKRTLVSTLVLMGIATVLIGALPTPEQVGVLAPVLLIALRFLQGISQGGEFAGALLFVTEHSSTEKRGFYAMFPVLGATLAVSVASAAFLVTSSSMSPEAFMSFGWRIPFLASAVLILIGLYIRLSVEETPAFTKVQERKMQARVPFFDALRNWPREILLAAGVGFIVFGFGYMGSTYLASYGTGTLQIEQDTVLFASTVGGIMYAVGVVVGSLIGARTGRRRFFFGFNTVAIVWAILMFWVLREGDGTIFILVVSCTFFLGGASYGPLGAFLPEQFPTRSRYTATGFSYNIAGVVGGGLTPVIAASLVANFGVPGFVAFLVLLAVIGLVCTFLLKDRAEVDLVADETDDAEAISDRPEVIDEVNDAR